MTSAASDITTLSDRQEIVDVITTLFIMTDERNWPAALACFADQVHFDMSSLTGAPAAAVPADSIVEGWKMILGAMQSVHHQVGNFRVRVEGNQAVAFCYGITYHYRPNGSGQNTRVIVGTYDFHLTKNGDAWHIDGFGFKVKLVEGNRELEKV